MSIYRNETLSKYFIAVSFIAMLLLPSRLWASSCKADLSLLDKDFCITDLNANGANKGPEVPLKYDWNISGDHFDLQFKSCIAASSDQALPQNILLAIDRSNTLAAADGAGLQKSSRSIELAKKIIEQVRSNTASKNTTVNIGVMMFSGSDDCKVFSGTKVDNDSNFPCLYTPLKATSLAGHLTYLSAFLDAADGRYAPQNELAGSEFTLIGDVLEKSKSDLEDGTTAVLLITDGKIYSGESDENFPYLNTKNYFSAQEALQEKFESKFKIAFTLNVALIGQTYNTYESQFQSSYESYCAINPSSSDCASTVAFDNPSTWPVNGVAVKPFLENLIIQTGNSTSALVAIDRISNELAATSLFNQLKASSEKLMTASIVKGNGERISSEIVNGQLLFRNLSVEDSKQIDIQFGNSESSSSTNVTVPLQLTFSDFGNLSEDSAAPDEMVCRDTNISEMKPNLFEKVRCGTIGNAAMGSVGGSYGLYLLALLLPLSFGMLKRHVRSKK